MSLSREEDQQSAMDTLAPVLSTVNGILESAVAFYFGKDYSDAARAEHTDRATANCIYSHAEKLMIQAESPSTGLHTIDIRGLHVLNYKDQALLRFKKVDDNGRHTNYPTKQQLDYDDQLPIPGLPDPAIRLTVGYQLDASGIALDRILVARPLGRNIFWTAQVIVDGAVPAWVDITPQRFGGTGSSDFDAERARGGRRGR